MVANKLLAGYGDLYVASYGVTAKILLLVTMLGIGIGAGVQPVIGYCYGAKNRERTNQFIRFSIFFATVVCMAVSVLCFIFARPVVGVFLTDATAMESSIWAQPAADVISLVIIIIMLLKKLKER